MKFNHGTAAYNLDLFDDCAKVAQNTIALVNGEHPNWEICCSRDDQFVGYIGLTCTGDCVAMFDRDCDSHMDRATGKRIAGIEEYRCDVEGWYASKCTTEAFVKNVQVEELWMYVQFYNEYLYQYMRRYSVTKENASKLLSEYKGFRHFPHMKQRFTDEMFSAYEKMLNVGVPIKVLIERGIYDTDIQYVPIGENVELHFIV